jgi:hypothetical protein
MLSNWRFLLLQSLHFFTSLWFSGTLCYPLEYNFTPLVFLTSLMSRERTYVYTLKLDERDIDLCLGLRPSHLSDALAVLKVQIVLRLALRNCLSQDSNPNESATQKSRDISYQFHHGHRNYVVGTNGISVCISQCCFQANLTWRGRHTAFIRSEDCRKYIAETDILIA